MSVLPMTEINLAAKDTGENLKVGPLTIRILEDGSRTDNRIGTVEIVVPPRTAGPPQHWHEMHDETFLVTSGVTQFLTGTTKIGAKTGDYFVVPPHSPHTFLNPFDQETRMINTFTPAYYVQYLRILDGMTRENDAKGEKGAPLDEEEVLRAMARFATLPAPGGKNGRKGKAFDVSK